MNQSKGVSHYFILLVHGLKIHILVCDSVGCLLVLYQISKCLFGVSCYPSQFSHGRICHETFRFLFHRVQYFLLYVCFISNVACRQLLSFTNKSKNKKYLKVLDICSLKVRQLSFTFSFWTWIENELSLFDHGICWKLVF